MDEVDYFINSWSYPHPPITYGHLFFLTFHPTVYLFSKIIGSFILLYGVRSCPVVLSVFFPLSSNFFLMSCIFISFSPLSPNLLLCDNYQCEIRNHTHSARRAPRSYPHQAHQGHHCLEHLKP